MFALELLQDFLGTAPDGRVASIRRRMSHKDVELTIGYGQELHRAEATFYVLRFRDIPAARRVAPRARRSSSPTTSSARCTGTAMSGP